MIVIVMAGKEKTQAKTFQRFACLHFCLPKKAIKGRRNEALEMNPSLWLDYPLSQ
jgi:hypothetical protein